VAEQRRLTGWGRSTATVATVETPASADEVAELLTRAPARGVVPRGLGRAYGDAALNAGGMVIDLRALRAVDYAGLEHDGTIRAEAGASLHAILVESVPRGWFVPVAPGTRQVTIGGAIAADVHGKDHHQAGSFMTHVQELTLATPAGIQVIGPESSLFAATFGGMGLTGVVLEAVLRMLPILSSRVVVDTDRAGDLDGALALMVEGASEHPYAVAWIDCMARGGSLGRAVVTRGRWAVPAELDTTAARDPLAFGPRARLAVPPLMPANFVSRPAALAFNELWFRKAPRERRGQIQSLSAFFHPLDALHGWNAVYGPRGFLQYQMVVPLEADEVLRQVIALLAARRLPSALSVLKRLGAASGGHLSFPVAGWTLAVDVSAGARGLGATLSACDELVAGCGGRVYLVKDARLRSEIVHTMYPRLEEWREIRGACDPDGIFASDQARRLRLVPASAT
jgi:decaprenylphospho-beta-D-ribofuranose 2-oxidase